MKKDQIATDTQKMHSILIDYYRISAKKELEHELKCLDVTSKLFGKDDKQLDEELGKLLELYCDEDDKQRKDLRKSLNGLKLSYDQVLPFTEKLEKDYAKIRQEKIRELDPYKSQVSEIRKFIPDLHERDKLPAEKRHLFFTISMSIPNVSKNYNKFHAYSLLLTYLYEFISGETIADSSPTEPVVFFNMTAMCEFRSFAYKLIGANIFNAVREIISDDNIARKELSNWTREIFIYIAGMMPFVNKIQGNVADLIEFESSFTIYKENQLDNFFDFDRYGIINLVEQNPKLEDCEREIGKLSSVLAYQIYNDRNITRFLYQKWKDEYYQEIKELFDNALKVADKLYNMVKDEVILSVDPQDDDWCRHKGDIRYILGIKEIAHIGVDKILNAEACPINQEEIKAALYKRFMKIREIYLKHIGK